MHSASLSADILSVFHASFLSHSDVRYFTLKFLGKMCSAIKKGELEVKTSLHGVLRNVFDVLVRVSPEDASPSGAVGTSWSESDVWNDGGSSEI